jgi:RNA polymerase sigma factor (sigma-70 family)
MELKTFMFSDKEKLFKEKTGKDFLSVYEKYYPKLIYFTNKICNDEQKAEDISTDSFMIALDKIEKYDLSKAQFSTWLFTIAKNLSLQELKNDKKSISLDIEYDSDGTTMKDFIFEMDEPNSEIKHEVKRQKSSIMLKHIEKLKEPYRTVIEMREIKKMSYKDISDHLGKNLSTIKSQIRNGRAILVKETFKDFNALDDMYL